LVIGYLVVTYRVFSARRPILEDSATLWAGSLSVLTAIVLLTPRHSAALKPFRAVSLALILGFSVAGISVFSPVHFIFMNVQDWASLLSGLVIVGAGFFVMRAWCRYLCPFGLVCGWAARHAIFQIETGTTCTRCGVCSRVCEVEAMDNGKIAVSSCIACMKCVDHCPEQALTLVARPFGGRGTGILPATTTQSGARAAARTGVVLGLFFVTQIGNLAFAQADSPRDPSVEVLWEGFRGDPQATAWRSFQDCATSEIRASWTFRGSSAVWNYAPGVSVWSSPAVAQVGNRAVCFVGSYDHNVYALDVATGRELWRYPTGNGVYSTPAVVRLDGRDCVLAASSDRTLYCLDAQKGIKLWSYEVYEWRQSLGRAFLSSPIVVFGAKGPSVVLIAWVFDTAPRQVTEQAEALAIAPENGTARLLWRRMFAESRPTHPIAATVGGQTRIYVGCRDGNLYCLDGRDGAEIWRKTSKFPIDGTPAFIKGSDSRPDSPVGQAGPDSPVGQAGPDSPVGQAGPGSLVGQAGPGSPVGQAGPGSLVGQEVRDKSVPPTGRPLVLVGSEFGDVRAFDADSGDRVWSFKTGHWVQATPAIVAGPDGKALAIFGSCDGRVYCLDARTGRSRWRYATRGNVVASAAVVPHDQGIAVYVPSDDDMLHAIDGRSGRGMWQFSPGVFLWAYRGLGDTIWESPAAVRIGDVDMLIAPFYDGRIHAYRLDRSSEWLPQVGDPAYGRAMLARIAASMIGTLILALVFVWLGTKRARQVAKPLQLRMMNEE
jgi:outer membrane protein assembly factor BamB/ferredoxin